MTKVYGIEILLLAMAGIIAAISLFVFIKSPPITQNQATMTIKTITPTKRAPEKININSATIWELDELPGIGQISAQKITDGRPYSSISALLEQKIVSKTTFEKIKGSIIVDY